VTCALRLIGCVCVWICRDLSPDGASCSGALADLLSGLLEKEPRRRMVRHTPLHSPLQSKS